MPRGRQALSWCSATGNIDRESSVAISGFITRFESNAALSQSLAPLCEELAELGIVLLGFLLVLNDSLPLE